VAAGRMWGAKIRRPPGEITDLQQDPKFWSPTRDLWGAEIRFARNCRSHSGRNSRFCPQAETQRQIDGPTEAIGGRSGGRGRSQAPFLIYMGLDAERRLGPSSRSQDNGGGDFKANRVYGPHRIAPSLSMALTLWTQHQLRARTSASLQRQRNRTRAAEVPLPAEPSFRHAQGSVPNRSTRRCGYAACLIAADAWTFRSVRPAAARRR
jgi:hypothetical protein